MSDERVCAIVSFSLAFQLAFCIDAIFRAHRVAIFVTAAGAFNNVGFLIALGFHAIPNINRIVLVSFHRRELTSDDIIANAVATVSVLLIRNSFRKYQSTKAPTAIEPTSVQVVGTCIMYRCCLELRPKRITEVPAPQPQPTGPSAQLRFVRSNRVYDARDTMMPRWLPTLSLQPWPRSVQCLLWLIGAVSVATLVGHHIVEHLIPGISREWFMAASLVAFFSASGFCGVYFVHCQRALLLNELGRSFDFLFVATQALFAHLAVCDLYNWDVRCFNVAATWLWAQWILSLDAVPPVMKRKLGFHKYGAVIIGLMLIYQQLQVFVTVIERNSSAAAFQERVLFSVRLGTRVMHVSVVSLLLGRIVAMSLWSMRIGWRLFDREATELLVLQGQLQYDLHPGPIGGQWTDQSRYGW